MVEARRRGARRQLGNDSYVPKGGRVRCGVGGGFTGGKVRLGRVRGVDLGSMVAMGEGQGSSGSVYGLMVDEGCSGKR